MKVVYIINSKKYAYHKQVLNDLMQICSGEVYDMSDGCEHNVRYNQIAECRADVIITLDAAGFELRTGNDTLSLNSLYCRCAHILFGKIDSYGSDIKARQNLSMFTYISTRNNLEEVSKQLREVPNIEYFCEYEYKSSDENRLRENRENLSKWWEAFCKSAMV